MFRGRVALFGATDASAAMEAAADGVAESDVKGSDYGIRLFSCGWVPASTAQSKSTKAPLCIKDSAKWVCGLSESSDRKQTKEKLCQGEVF